MRATVMYGAGDVRVETVPDAHLLVAPRVLSHLLCKPEVAGSIPARSMAQPSHLRKVSEGSDALRALDLSGLVNCGANRLTASPPRSR